MIGRKQRKWGYMAIVLVFCTMLSCESHRFENKEELLAYIQKEGSGYKQSKTVNGVDFIWMYRPTDLVVSQEIKKQEDIAKLRAQYKQYMYMSIGLSSANTALLNTVAGDPQRFSSLVNQLAFRMGEKVHLYTEARDTLVLADYIYPRMYGLGNSSTMLFVFERKEEKLKGKYLNLTIEDIGFGTGEVRFRLPIDKIKNEPQISFKK